MERRMMLAGCYTVLGGIIGAASISASAHSPLVFFLIAVSATVAGLTQIEP